MCSSPDPSSVPSTYVTAAHRAPALWPLQTPALPCTRIFKNNVLGKLIFRYYNNSSFKNILIWISHTIERELAFFAYFQALNLFHLVPPILGDSIIPTLLIRKITQEEQNLTFTRGSLHCNFLSHTTSSLCKIHLQQNYWSHCCRLTRAAQSDGAPPK